MRRRLSALRTAGIRASAVALALAFLLPATSMAAPASNPNRVYFSQTGHYLAYGFLNYWRQHGGLMQFGYPITDELSQNGMTVQYFQRAVLEYHPNAPQGWKVQLRRLGAIQTANRMNEAPFKPVSGQTDQNCTFYQATQHRLCFGFRQYWQDHGGLAIFGYPISEEFTENGFTVQYFERARFEYHPNNPPQFQVLLGLLGNSAAQQDGVDTSAVQPSSDVPMYDPSLWTPTRCYSWQLSLTQTAGSAATGHRQLIFALQNTSQTTCTLYGYPGMQMYGSHGQALTTNVQRGHAFEFRDVTPMTVTLTPGATASFAIGYEVIPTGNQSEQQQCPAATRLLVTPPNDFNQLALSSNINPCSGVIHVSPVVAGQPGVNATTTY